MKKFLSLGAVCILVITLFIASKPKTGKFGEVLSNVLKSDSRNTYTVYIFFKDKGPEAEKFLLNQPALVTERSLERRAKVMPAGKLIGFEDIPVYGGYVDNVSSHVLKIRHTLKYVNAISAEVNKAQLYAIADYGFVDKIELVETMIKNRNFDESVSDSKTHVVETLQDQPLSDSLNYGSGFTQISQIHVNDVHNQGIFGQGVIIANFDEGFKNQAHEVFTTLPTKILKQHDFQLNDTVAYRTGGSHGTNTMSLVGGYKPGQMIGPAFRSSFIVARTEVDSFERPIEMDNWTAAAYWADSLGADIVTSSLGYLAFDSGYPSWTWQDMNGHTLVSTLAAVWLQRHGVVVCNSAGNNGQSSGQNTLNSPADADSIVTVGAVESNGVVASFSSSGPTTDIPARIKPDVDAMGSDNYVASTGGSSSYTIGSGTSYSCPLTAGVCGLMLSANKNLTPPQVISLLKKFASNTNSPNNSIGWGIINAKMSVDSARKMDTQPPTIVHTLPFTSTLNTGVITVKAMIKDNGIIRYTRSTEAPRLYYRKNTGSGWNAYTPVNQTSVLLDTFYFAIPGSSLGTQVQYYFAAEDIALPNPNLATLPAGGSGINPPGTTAPSTAFAFLVGTPSGISNGEIPAEYKLYNNYPNPFNPSTSIKFSIKENNFVTLKIYDIRGREVAKLVNQPLTAGTYEMKWDAANFSSGVYFYSIQAGDFKDVKRLTLIK
ncbi:MAG: S8 family serine peptidase [Ignavibacteria bacterium]|nr:S8 family serine peptidase [Ignavibacteria bacterium]